MSLNQPVIDSLSLATQFGRLDFISAVLASLAVILVFGGVFSFLNFRNIAKEQATASSQEIAQLFYLSLASQFVDNENSVVSAANTVRRWIDSLWV